MNEHLVTQKFLKDLILPLKDSSFSLSDWVDVVQDNRDCIFVCRLNKGYQYGGPYIVLWATDCHRLMSWTTTEGVITNICYRTSPHGLLDDESLSSETLQSAFVDRYKDVESPDFYLLPKNEQVRECLRDDLVLDSDLFRGIKSDKEIPHKKLLVLIEEYGIKIVAETPAAVETKKETEMTTTASTTSKINSITNRVKSAGMGAAEFQAGKAMNVAVMKMVKPKLPMMLRGYADHAAAPAVIALAVALASEFVPEGASKEKLIKASDLMLNAAVMEGADKLLNIEAIIDGVLSQMPKEAAELIQN